MTRLNQTLLRKIAGKMGKDVRYVRQQVSKRATRNGIPSEAELIRWARELKIGAGRALQALPPHIQAQAYNPATVTRTKRVPVRRVKEGESKNSKPDPVLAAIPVLLSDAELRDRCADVLRRPRNFDRAVASATTVLEARVRTRAGLPKRATGVKLIARALNPDPKKAILVVSDEPDEQEGFFNLCKGVTSWFRNYSHHHLDEKLTRVEALRLCAFVDLLLPIIEMATVHETT